MNTACLTFGPYRLDPGNVCVWRGQEEIRLAPKAFAVLEHLIQHQGRLVSKDELFEAVWAGTAVGDAALTFSIGEIRRALGDKAKAPQYIETVHRRGYRFVAPLTSAPPVLSSESRVLSPLSSPLFSALSRHVVGREKELIQLHSWFQQALEGQRQLVFVTGEPGIGKTTVVDTFVERMRDDARVWLGRGQCIEHYGAGEAYMPVLEALGRLCRQPDGQQLIEQLDRYAPSWLAQLPSVLSPDKLAEVKQRVIGLTPERMLREMAEAVEAFTTEQTLILVLEDLHWSDHATLEFLAMLARRPEAARLLVISTYRPVEVLVYEHPLQRVKQELQLHGQCQELALEFLTEQDVQAYLVYRWNNKAGDNASLRDVARFIHHHTDGNPLFMVNMLEYLIRHGVVAETDGSWELRGKLDATAVGVPDSLRQMIEVQINRTSPVEQRTLEAASAAGPTFSAAAVAAGLGQESDEIEEVCAVLARREQFIGENGTLEWPDGTVATRYNFLHAMYQDTLYERVPVGRRVHLHKRIGERQEAAYGERAREIATELAVHFERGQDSRRAVSYLQQAADTAIERSAHQEAVHLLTHGLDLLQTWPDSPERQQQELQLQKRLSAAFIVVKGFGAPEVEVANSRAWELCQQCGELRDRFEVLGAQWAFYTNRAQYAKACAIARHYLELAKQEDNPYVLTWGHHLMVEPWFLQGEFTQARAHAEQTLEHYEADMHRPQTARIGGDPEVMSRSYIALVLWSLGYPDQALQQCHAGLRLARELSVPFALSYALSGAAYSYLFRRDWAGAQAFAEELIAMSTAQGFATRIAQGTILRGGVLALQGQVAEGIAQIQQGMAARRTTGSEMFYSHDLALLAEAYLKAGHVDEGLRCANEAHQIVATHQERMCEAELYRLKGEVLLGQERQKAKGKGQKAKLGDAEECFQRALAIARRQKAKAWELRAAISLARLWRQHGKKAEALSLVTEIYDWFTEGFDTLDLQEAQVLIEELKTA